MILSKVSAIQSSGVSTVEGLESIEVNGDIIQIFRIIHYIAGVRS